MSIEEKFRAAVNVIRSLPKDGAFQPSHELMLRFYAYFKQATEGPCKGSRPAFWEVVNRMKYDAWAKLGNMPAEEAMKNYVEELRQIAETMSYTEDVAKFMGSLGPVYETVPVSDLEMLLGPTIERMRSMPGSPISNTPLGSRETSPSRVSSMPNQKSLSVAASSSSSRPTSPSDEDEDEDEDEEFIDTVEVSDTIPDRVMQSSIARSNHQPNGIPHHKQNGDISCGPELEQQERGRPRERGSPSLRRKFTYQAQEKADITDQMRDVVINLQRDLDRVTARVRSLEASALSRVPASLSAHQPECHHLTQSYDTFGEIGLNAEALHGSRTSRINSWWPFRDLSPRTVLLITAWPIVVQLFILWLQRRRATLTSRRAL